MEKIQKPQNKVLYLITGAPRYFNTDQLPNELKVDLIKKVIDSQIINRYKCKQAFTQTFLEQYTYKQKL